MNNSIIISLENDISEIVQLAESLDYKVKEIFIQNRKTPHVNSYIGKGKLEKIKEYIENSDNNINLVIVDGELKPSQWFLLEKEFGVTVYDRVRLILSIFEKRAERKEARLQVHLAQLQYERPFVRELIHRARSGEHPGFMAGGEYQVDDYYEKIKKQTKKIKNELKNIRNQRELRRRYRRISGFYLISLAGYTNAGKSSLLNLLSNEKVKVEEKLFSTLSTTTRQINNNDIPVLLTDTVGFIKNLPTIIIDAFHSTLEEIEVADVVVLLVDISEDYSIIEKKLKVSIHELVEIGVESTIIITFNKIDLISENEISLKIKKIINNDLLKGYKICNISTKKNQNIKELLKLIYSSLPRIVQYRIRLPFCDKSQALLSWIYDKTNVKDVTYHKNIDITGECNIQIKDKISSICKKIEGCRID